MAQTVNFTVTGEQKIHCMGCEEHHELSAAPSRDSVTFDPARVSPDKVKAKLEQLGYHV